MQGYCRFGDGCDALNARCFMQGALMLVQSHVSHVSELCEKVHASDRQDH